MGTDVVLVLDKGGNAIRESRSCDTDCWCCECGPDDGQEGLVPLLADQQSHGLLTRAEEVDDGMNDVRYVKDEHAHTTLSQRHKIFCRQECATLQVSASHHEVEGNAPVQALEGQVLDTALACSKKLDHPIIRSSMLNVIWVRFGRVLMMVDNPG